MPSSRQLSAFQETDFELDTCRTRLEVIAQELSNDRGQRELSEQIEALSVELVPLRDDQRAFELEEDQFLGKVRVVEERLYGGAVRNPRELEDLQQELRQIQSFQRAAGDSALILMERGDVIEAQLQSLRSQLEAATSLWEGAQEDLGRERIQIEKEVVLLDSQREIQARLIDEASLVLYQHLRSALKGYAVARVERGLCLGCRVSLPTYQIPRVRADRELVQCPSCHRILYVR